MIGARIGTIIGTIIGAIIGNIIEVINAKPFSFKMETISLPPKDGQYV